MLPGSEGAAAGAAVKLRDADHLAHTVLHALRSLEVVEVRTGYTWRNGFDADALVLEFLSRTIG